MFLHYFTDTKAPGPYCRRVKIRWRVLIRCHKFSKSAATKRWEMPEFQPEISSNCRGQLSFSLSWASMSNLLSVIYYPSLLAYNLFLLLFFLPQKNSSNKTEGLTSSKSLASSSRSKAPSVFFSRWMFKWFFLSLTAVGTGDRQLKITGSRGRREWCQSSQDQSGKMALETVSRIFDVYRQNGSEGEQILRTTREKISSSFKTSSLGIKNQWNSV